MTSDEAFEAHFSAMVFPYIPPVFKKSVMDGAYAHNKATWDAALEFQRNEDKHEQDRNS